MISRQTITNTKLLVLVLLDSHTNRNLSGFPDKSNQVQGREVLI